MHVLVTRPREDSERLARRLEDRGHRVTIAPLIEIRFDDACPINLVAIAGLIATSRNAVRAAAAHRQFAALSPLPLYTVGPGTAEAAQQAGFTRIVPGTGDGAALARSLSTRPELRARSDRQPPLLLHLSGDTVAFDMAEALAGHGLPVRRKVLYRTEEIEHLPAPTADVMRSGDLDGVILLSPRTARVYARCIAADGLVDAAQDIVHVCMSQAVADGLNGSVSNIVLATAPNLEAVLDAIANVAAERIRRP